jgi:serine protease
MLGQPAPDLQVMQASGISSEALAARLAQQADVEYAVPDRIKTIRALPTDPLLGNQWYLQAPGITQPAAIDAVGAWSLTGGSASVVVAVVDTGVRFDHEDLAAPLLPGYDFIADGLNSGDGDSDRDADASDPGDYLSSADLANATLRSMCGTSDTHASSWHGTQVAGIVAAQANNGLGIAGVGGATRVLPVRVLGKCGGFDSDIIAGMRWAAGLTVPGVPANPNPARVINLSLAGGSGCSSAYASAIAEIRQAGALIVAAAGNETSPVEEPASCAGVLAVAGIRHAGTKVGYSSYGPEVGISAPAGNCVNILSGQPCLFPSSMPSTSARPHRQQRLHRHQRHHHRHQLRGAPGGGHGRADDRGQPGLGEAEIASRIKRSARAFPVDSNLPICPAIDGDGQCNCTTITCGAGCSTPAPQWPQPSMPGRRIHPSSSACPHHRGPAPPSPWVPNKARRPPAPG